MTSNQIWFYLIALLFSSKSSANQIDMIEIPIDVGSHTDINHHDFLEMKKYQKMAYEVILNMPNLIEIASSLIKEKIKKKFNIDINPNKAYLNRFKSASNNHDTITGWEHCGDLTKSETLTQTVLTNFSAFNHENPDFLDDYVGVYKEGVGARCYDHRNEIRIRPSELMNLIWDMNFSKIYGNALTNYWGKYENEYRMVVKGYFITRLLKQYTEKNLSPEGYHLSLKLVDNISNKYKSNNLSFTSLSIDDLKYENFSNNEYDVFPFKIEDYISTDILLVINKSRTQYILYIPNNIIEFKDEDKKNYKEKAFLEFNSLEKIKNWLKIQSLDEKKKNQLLSHFSLHDRQKGIFHKSVNEIIEKNIWDAQYTQSLDLKITEDAFRFLTKQQKIGMENDADTQIKSNAEIRWDLAVLNLSALSTVLLPLQAIQPELGLITTGGLWLSETGINIEKSFNADSFEERKAAFHEAVSSSINAVVSILFFSALSKTSEPLESVLKEGSPTHSISPVISSKKTNEFMNPNKSGEWMKLRRKDGDLLNQKSTTKIKNMDVYENPMIHLKDKPQDTLKLIKNPNQPLSEEKSPFAKSFLKIQPDSISLPELPSINLLAEPIPKKIHYIWLGDKNIREELIKNMARNSWNSSHYQSIVHVFASPPNTFNKIKNQLRGILNLSVSNLKNESFFNQFKNTLSGEQFQIFLKKPAKNYAAASDVLRYWILDQYGGIYLDTDDIIPNDVSKTVLIAGPQDILLNSQIECHPISFKGYNTSHFASHSNNPVLKKIIKEMEKRYAENQTFYTQERPYLKKDEKGNEINKNLVNDYMKKIFHQVGPQLFNDILKEEIKSYYDLNRSMKIISMSDPLPKEWELYKSKLNEALDYYLPFYRKFKIEIGNENSWNYTR